MKDELAYSANHVYREGYDDGYDEAMKKIDEYINETVRKLKECSYTVHSELFAEHFVECWNEVKGGKG